MKSALAVFVVLAGLLAGCGSRNGSAALPDDPRATGLTGQFVWQDLLTDDLDSSRRFYADLLDWEFEEASGRGGRYLLARSVLGYIGGLAEVSREDTGRPVSQWLSYMRVPDVDGAVQQVSESGGRILATPFDRGPARVAVVVDPLGAVLGLSSQELGLPGRDPRVAPTGTFFWRDYLARDVETARQFYGTLAGLEAERESRSDGVIHYVLRRTRNIGGIVEITQRDIAPHWLPSLRVDDPADLARNAQRLGGRVLMAPSAETRNGSVAIIADPQGATVALQRYPF